MKKRQLLLPSLYLSVLMGCSNPNDSWEEQKHDTKNRYKTIEDCKKDNPEDKAGKDPCEHVNNYYVGPAYPYGYYGHSGFYQGYWMGRISSSQGVIYNNTFVTHEAIASSGGSVSGATTSGRGTAISRGGFGSSAHSSFSGS